MIRGMSATKAALRRIEYAVEAAAPAAQQVVGEEVAASARSQVPVLTGETQASIQSSTDGASAGGAALYLEFGTSFMSAQPFLRPAADGASGAGAEIVMRAAIARVV